MVFIDQSVDHLVRLVNDLVNEGNGRRVIIHYMKRLHVNKAFSTFLIRALVASGASCAGGTVESETEMATVETEVTETTEETASPVIYNNQLFEDFESGDSICFVGDSITYGSAFEEAIPWYDPLLPFIRGEVMNYSQGGWTSTYLVSILDELPQADIYVVAIGINDVLFIDQPLGAASAEEFVDNLNTFTDAATNLSPDATIYFIAPWPFLDQPDETYVTRQEFADAMESWCNDEGWYFMDPSDIILDVLEEVDTSVYMWNEYHPDQPEGIGLYSYAVMLSASQMEVQD